MTGTDSTTRFSKRVDDYVRYRPGYPAELVPALLEHSGFDSTARVADIGSGTGIFTTRLLQQELEVWAVEPNAPMRAAAEAACGGNPLFHSIDASAEQTGLDSESIDLITAAQAFHWFDNAASRTEFRRILKPDGRLALIWNRRDTRQPFQQVYDALLNELAPEYGKVNHMSLEQEQIASWFAAGEMRLLEFDNHQQLDFANLLGRLRSASYCPAEDSPHFIPLVNELLAQFDHYADQGQVDFAYNTQLFIGPIRR